MIKTIVTDIKPQHSEFPKLMTSIMNHDIVLFKTKTEGVCVHSQEGNVGVSSDMWDAEYFVDFKGEVELTNSIAANPDSNIMYEEQDGSVTVKVTDATKLEEFPMLRIHRPSNVVVLFTNKNSGTIVAMPEKSINAYNEPVLYRDDWVYSSFSEFYGKVLLKND